MRRSASRSRSRVQLQLQDRRHVLVAQRIEPHDLVDPGSPAPAGRSPAESPAQVRGHDHDHVREVHGAPPNRPVNRPSSSSCSSTPNTSGCAFSTSSSSTHRIGPAPHGPRSAGRPRRSPRTPAAPPMRRPHRVPVQVLAHVYAHHGPARRRTAPRPAPGPARSCRRRWGPAEQERPHRPPRVAQPRPVAPDGVRHGGHGHILAHHPVVQHLLQVHQLVDLALQQPGHGDAGGLRHHLGDVAESSTSSFSMRRSTCRRRQLRRGGVDRRDRLRQPPVDDSPPRRPGRRPAGGPRRQRPAACG